MSIRKQAPHSPMGGRFPRLLVLALLLASAAEALVPPTLASRSNPAGVVAFRWSSKLAQSNSGSTSPVVSKRKKKQKLKKGSRPSPSTAQALSEDELVQHVATQYMTGRGGPLEDRSTRQAFQETGERAEFMKQLNSRPVLVLNANYQPLSYLPLSVWNWQDTIKSIFGGKVTVVDVYPDLIIRAASLEVPLPSVIALNEYIPKAGQQKPAFTRRNVFLRDAYTCQYCSQRFHTSHLTLDHVLPRSKGGTLSWENAVTSCQVCNGRKGSRTLQELRMVGMKLTQVPSIPTQFELASRAARMVPKKIHSTWAPYLGFVSSPANTMPSSDMPLDSFDGIFGEMEMET